MFTFPNAFLEANRIYRRNVLFSIFCFSCSCILITTQAFGFEKSLLREALRKLPVNSTCRFEDEALAQAFPQFANGPTIAIENSQGTKRSYKTPDRWLFNSFRYHPLQLCAQPEVLSQIVNQVHAASKAECAKRGKVAEPLWVLVMRATSQDVDPKSLELLSESEFRRKMGKKYRYREPLKFDYYRNGEGKMVRQGVSTEAVQIESHWFSTALLYKIAPYTNELDLRNRQDSHLPSGTNPKPVKVRGLDAEQGLIEKVAARNFYERMESSGIQPDIECEEGYCLGPSQQPGPRRLSLYFDDRYQGRRVWANNRFAKIYSYESEPKASISSIEYLRPDCKIQDGKTLCHPISQERLLPPLEECVDEPIKAIFDKVGLENSILSEP